MQNALTLLLFHEIWLDVVYVYMFISIKTLSRFVWKGAVCVSNTSIHHVYILSMVILQITDVNDISGFVSVHVCVCVRVWEYMPWPFTVKMAFLLDTPGSSHFSPLSSSFRICSPLYDLFKFWARLNLPGDPAAVLHVRQVGLCVPDFRSRALVLSHKFSH